ncbi:MAG: DUF1176 domain-containing protein [Brevundimonas sp.]|uniref:DUF1176 domain-containing protein n=1 Tax=Brevundimonas sp. TaxID=1871086 RepID=UPI00258E5F2E|nr:DUF1176 domain-containing protein [Brevundimonas sp.]MCV0414919.1 DUF1176 domain-containing protein [Brevundimonas sp.]
MRPLAICGLSALLLAGCGQGAGQKGDDQGDAAAPAASAAVDRPAGDVLSAQPEQRAFRDWRAACDNGAACFAFAPSSLPDQGWLRLALAPEAQAAPRIAVGLWSPGAEGLAPTAPLTLTIDGRAFVTRRDPDADLPVGQVEAADAPVVARALAAGRKAILTAGGQRVDLSLSGAAAALLWIDERQGRLDTPGALVRVGDRPASTRAPELPRVAAAPPADQAGFGDEDQTLPKTLEALPAVKACRQETAWNDYVQKAVFSARLSADRELWAVPCFAGAYNLGSAVYVTGPNGADPMPVAFPVAEGGTVDTVVNAAYDPATRSLSAFNKGRGVGDCGVAQRWVWNGRGFALAEQSEMRDCAGVPRDLWPSLWRSR